MLFENFRNLKKKIGVGVWGGGMGREGGGGLLRCNYFFLQNLKKKLKNLLVLKFKKNLKKNGGGDWGGVGMEGLGYWDVNISF